MERVREGGERDRQKDSEAKSSATLRHGFGSSEPRCQWPHRSAEDTLMHKVCDCNPFPARKRHLMRDYSAPNHSESAWAVGKLHVEGRETHPGSVILPNRQYWCEFGLWISFVLVKPSCAIEDDRPTVKEGRIVGAEYPVNCVVLPKL